MSIPLTGSGGLFTRIGKLGGTLNLILAHKGTDVPARVAALASAWAGSPAEVDGLYSAFGRYPSADAVLAYLRSLASRTVVDMANADVPLPDRSLGTALSTLIAQMVAGAQTVQSGTVALSISAASGNVGDPAWVATTLDSTGLALPAVFAEAIGAACSGDSQSGTAAAGSEPIRLRGAQAAASPLDPAWPAGSGADLTISAVDPALDAPGGARQALRNGAFEAWTVPNVPDRFTIRAGAAGAQVLRSSSPYAGTYALSFVGDSATNTALDQQFGTDTPTTLLPSASYAWGLRCKVATAPAAGVLEVALVDGSGAVTLDGRGTANAATVDLTTLGSSYVARGGVFRTPRVLPPTLRLRLRLSTPLSSGSTLAIDHLAFTRPVPLYVGGPRVTLFSGATPMVLGDAWTLTATNARGGMESLFDRIFDMKGLGLIVPSSGSPTIADSLIS